MIGRKILLIENFSDDFYNARLPLAKYLLEGGWDVYALIPEGEYVDLIEQAGVKPIVYQLNRKDKGMKQLIRLIGIYRSVIREHSIDIVHSFRFQPNLLNVLANFFNKKKVILHITGLGIAFSNSSFFYRLLRLISQFIFQVKLIRANKVIVQNPDDINDIWLNKVWSKKMSVISGSGIDTILFDKKLFDKRILRANLNILETDVVFICVTRLIWEKGIKEMTDAFHHMKEEGKNCKLWIVGWSDMDNPRHVEDAYIRHFENDSNIFFMGKKKNVRELLAAADVFLYPSYYREGIPRGILEALSMSLPIITTDMPGCKLTVIQDRNGYLIKPRSADEICSSVNNLLKRNDMVSMGDNSRILAKTKFSNSIIFSEIASLYN